MISQILKSLSDTELVVIAKELNNPEVDNSTIYKQLLAKDNNGDSDSLLNELGKFNKRTFGQFSMVDSTINVLACKVALELSDRLLKVDQEK